MLALVAPFANGNPVKLELDRFEQFRTGLKRQAVRIEGQLSAGTDMKMLSVSDRVVWIRDGIIDRIEKREDLDISVGSIEGDESGGVE